MTSQLAEQPLIENPDAVLIGGGIMSATLGTMLKRLNPDWKILIVEALPRVAMESSYALNNAGTGHAALCELNYTSVAPDGSFDISKAVNINAQFEMSKHFWSYLVETGVIKDPSTFIQRVDHMSFVQGEENQQYLKKRYEAMKAHPFFSEMEYTTDHQELTNWCPLLTEARDPKEPVAATRIQRGTDVNFGAVTREMFAALTQEDGIQLLLKTTATNITKESDGSWRLQLQGPTEKQTVKTPYTFIGAGGGALALLQKSGIPEGKGFAGFPVSGKFLICKDPEIVKQHAAKVYGKAAFGAPPMSVPHLDSRSIDGKPSLLFGPFAGFSPKFQKSGSNADLFKSIRPDNLFPMLAVGRDNMPLTQYLIKECMKKHEDRCESLRAFFPAAKNEDWALLTAGQRVQIIKKDDQRTGKLQFGTEVVASKDRSLATVLGASPGASTAVAIILEVLTQCFPNEMTSAAWQPILEAFAPAYQKDLANEPELYASLCNKVDTLLNIGELAQL